MPRRVSSAQASSAESCWLHDVRTLATRDLSNETSRERFTCVVAYSFVWRDSRTSVTLCTPHRPNCMLTSLQCRLLSAEFCSAYRTLESPESPLVLFSSPVIRHPVCRRHRSRPFAVRRHPLKKRTNSVVMPAAVSLLSRAQDFSRAEHFPQFVQLSASRQSRTSGQSGEAPSR